jgi:hypothetical protein
LVYGYHPKKTRQVHSSLKCILTVFLTFTWLCLPHSFQMVKLWTNVFIQMFCGVCWKMCGGNGPRNESMETGFFTMTELPFTLLRLCRNLWPKTAWLLFRLPPPLTPRCSTLEFSYFSNTCVGTEVEKIRWHHHDSKKSQALLADTGLLQMLSTVKWTVSSLYQVSRE